MGAQGEPTGAMTGRRNGGGRKAQTEGAAPAAREIERPSKVRNR